jgi:hypothetical protein
MTDSTTPQGPAKQQPIQQPLLSDVLKNQWPSLTGLIGLLLVTVQQFGELKSTVEAGTELTKEHSKAIQELKLGTMDRHTSEDDRRIMSDHRKEEQIFLRSLVDVEARERTHLANRVTKVEQRQEAITQLVNKLDTYETRLKNIEKVLLDLRVFQIKRYGANGDQHPND